MKTEVRIIVTFGRVGYWLERSWKSFWDNRNVLDMGQSGSWLLETSLCLCLSLSLSCSLYIYNHTLKIYTFYYMKKLKQRNSAKMHISFFMVGGSRCNNLSFILEGVSWHSKTTRPLKISPMWEVPQSS